MRREKEVYKIAGQYCSRLGLPVPEIRVQQGVLSGESYNQTRYLGSFYPGSMKEGDLRYIVINPRGKNVGNIRTIRNTMAHEAVHYAFPRLSHRADFDRRTKALTRSKLFFRGRMLRGKGKVEVLDTEKPIPELGLEDRVRKARASIKGLDTKIKRLTTIKKKWERMLSAYKKMRGKEQHENNARIFPGQGELTWSTST